MKKKTESILSYVVLIFSIINIYTHQNQLISLSVLLSIIGIIGFSSFLLKNNLYKILFLIWIIAQFLIIDVSEMKNGIKYISSIFDLSQVFKIKLGIGLTYTPKTYNIGINIIPFGFYFLYKILMTNSFISKMVRIIPVSEQSPIAQFTPLDAKIIDVENGFLIAELKEIINIDNVNYHKIMFKTIDKSIFKMNKIRQKCYLKLLSENKEMELETEGFIN